MIYVIMHRYGLLATIYDACLLSFKYYGFLYELQNVKCICLREREGGKQVGICHLRRCRSPLTPYRARRRRPDSRCVSSHNKSQNTQATTRLLLG